MVGISPYNRDSKKMSARSMIAKGTKIVRLGASRDLCGSTRAWCCAEDPDTREVMDWTKACARTSECSHVNQILHAINCERPSASTYINDKHGHIDKKTPLPSGPHTETPRRERARMVNDQIAGHARLAPNRADMATKSQH